MHYLTVRSQPVEAASQILFFKAATGYAFTIFLAGFALTITSLPKISRLPAFVAGLVRSFKRHKPGIAKAPVFFTSFEATSAKLFSTLEQIFCFNSNEVANAFARLPFVMARAAVLVVAFIGLFVFPC